jgi:hypothetical protein
MERGNRQRAANIFRLEMDSFPSQTRFRLENTHLGFADFVAQPALFFYRREFRAN